MTAVASSREADALDIDREGASLVRPVAWFALALIGEVARLRLIQAGPLVGYQHYLRVDQLFTTAPLATSIVAAQGVIAAVGLRRTWSALRGWIVDRYAGLRLAAIAALFMMFSAALSKEPVVFGSELVLASVLQLIALATIICAAASLPVRGLDIAAARARSLLEPGTDESPIRADRFAWLLAAWVVLVCALLALFSYQAHPHVPDEVSYIYQARYFAEGLLELPPPPVASAFDLDLMTFEATRWYSPVPPGWPAVLSLGYLAGVPWLINPLLNGANIVLAYLVIGDVYGRRTARWSVILLASSPWFLFMGMNFMTHTAALFFTLVAALSVARMRRSGALGWGVLGGAAIGVVSLIRPLEGLAVAALLGLWALGGRSRWPLALPQVAVLALATIAVGALVFPYNTAIAGDPTTFPLMAYTDAMYGEGVNALGFGANRGIGWPGLDPFPGHGVLDIFINGALNGYQVNVELLGWSVGSLLPIALLVFSGRLRREDWWMLAAVGTIVGLHSFYWFAGGPDFGARYWYLIIVPCIALAARGIEEAAGVASGEADAKPAIRVAVGALALCVIAVGVYVPWRAVDKYHHYRRMEPGVERLAREHGFGESLVLIRGRRHPDYASAATYNPLDLRAPEPVYAWDRDVQSREAVLAAYPERPVWFVAGPTESGNGFRVLAGPLTARQAREWSPDAGGDNGGPR